MKLCIFLALFLYNFNRILQDFHKKGCKKAGPNSTYNAFHAFCRLLQQSLFQNRRLRQARRA